MSKGARLAFQNKRGAEIGMETVGCGEIRHSTSCGGRLDVGVASSSEPTKGNCVRITIDCPNVITIESDGRGEMHCRGGMRLPVWNGVAYLASRGTTAWGGGSDRHGRARHMHHHSNRYALSIPHYRGKEPLCPVIGAIAPRPAAQGVTLVFGCWPVEWRYHNSTACRSARPQRDGERNDCLAARAMFKNR